MNWVLSTIIGDGTLDIVSGQELTTGPYRLKVSMYGDHIAIIPGDINGVPQFNWGLARFEGDVVSADADADLIVLPSRPLDHVLTAGERSWLITKLGNRGFATGWITDGITVREVARTIGRWLDDKFDINWVGI